MGRIIDKGLILDLKIILIFSIIKSVYLKNIRLPMTRIKQIIKLKNPQKF